MCPGFPPTSPHAPFPFAAFALYPFAVLNHTCEYDYMLSPVNSPKESELGSGLRDPHLSLTHTHARTHTHTQNR